VSDLQTLREMFARADVNYVLDEASERTQKQRPNVATALMTSSGFDGTGEPGAGNGGYMGFFTLFEFDADGMLLMVSAWE